MRPRWRVIAGHPAYEVSHHGIIRRCLPGRGTFVGRKMRQCRNINGYLYVSLDSERCFVHVLVCETFHGPKPTIEHEAAHDNGCKRDNRSRNIHWKTAEENALDKRRHGRSKGGRHHFAKLTAAQVRRIRWLGRKWPGPAIAARFNTTKQNVSLILTGQAWTHLKGCPNG